MSWAIASAFSALLAVGCLVRVWADAAGDAGGELARRRWLQATAVSLGLLVASGPLAWSFLLLLGVAGAGGLIDAPARPAGTRRALERRLVGRLLGVAAASAVLAATAGLTRWQGLPAVSASLTAWTAQWRDAPGLAGLVSLLERLLLEQPLTLGLGRVRRGARPACHRAAGSGDPAPAPPHPPHQWRSFS